MRPTWDRGGNIGLTVSAGVLWHARERLYSLKAALREGKRGSLAMRRGKKGRRKKMSRTMRKSLLKG